MNKFAPTNLATLAAASRDFQTAGPVRFARDGANAAGATGLKFSPSETPTGSLIDSWGDLPKTQDEIMAAIHAMQPADADKLTPEGIYYRACEAANSNFIADRYMFLGSGTLLNIAKGGKVGFAFMNSHRTGGWLGDAELPYGVTVAGRYEQYVAANGDLYDRALLGIYMLKGSVPNAGGLSTDTIYSMILGGVLRDVSVGIYPGIAGRRLCDVCGCDYYGGDCPHYAGSTYQMNDQQKAAQARRGILSGIATVTLDLWEPGEVSATYDGALPGAGFAKVQEALERGILPADVALQLASAYAVTL